jgi:AcrR family transcriptional regulator
LSLSEKSTTQLGENKSRDRSMSSVVGLRERGKRDKLRRIKDAAFDIFRSKGYEAASTREIALAADVSIGTIFLYAKDKRDLLCLVLNQDLDEVFQSAVASLPPAGSVERRLRCLLAPIYEYFSREPELARAMNREIIRLNLVEETGEQVEQFRNRLKAWSKAIQKIVDESRSEDLVGVDSAVLAEILFDVHLAHVRRWLNDEVPSTADGLAGLMRRVRIILRGRQNSTSRGNFKRATKGAHTKTPASN